MIFSLVHVRQKKAGSNAAIQGTILVFLTLARLEAGQAPLRGRNHGAVQPKHTQNPFVYLKCLKISYFVAQLTPPCT